MFHTISHRFGVLCFDTFASLKRVSFLLALVLVAAACSSSNDAGLSSNTSVPVTADPSTPTTERLPLPLNIDIVETSLRNQGFPEENIPGVIDCVAEQAEAEGLEFVLVETEEFAVLLVRCSPNFLALSSTSGIVAPPGVADIQVICAGEVMLQQIGSLPLLEAADQLFRPDPVVRPEWAEGVSTACDLSAEDTQLVLGQ